MLINFMAISTKQQAISTSAISFVDSFAQAQDCDMVQIVVDYLASADKLVKFASDQYK